MNTADARKHAELQWTENPCGAVGGSTDTLDYFLGVERERYRQQSWQARYFGFYTFMGKRVLEIGVGQGTDLAQFATEGAECHGIDITEAHLELARRNFSLRGSSVTLTKADATSIPYPDGYFDTVYSFGVIHHIPDAKNVAHEINRVLKPGGTVMLGLYRKWSLFHAYQLLWWIWKFRFLRLSYSSLLARIETGADGVNIKPYVKLYTGKEVQSLLSDFEIEDTSVKHLFLGRHERAWMRPLLDFLEPFIGWYLVCKARKH